MSEVAINTQLGAVRDDELRVLVVGAGVAGTSLAQLLRRRGLHPVLVERAAAGAGSGYMLGLLPLADPVLDQLGVGHAYRAGSVLVPRYLIRDRRGRPAREYRLDQVLGRRGHYRGISRGDLLALIATGGCPVTHRATVTAIDQHDERVGVRVRTRTDAGTSESYQDFDLVVAADGMYSATRDLVLPADQVSHFETGTGGWVGWIEPTTDPHVDPIRFEELWGAGMFIGTYPVPGRTGAFVGGPLAEMAAGPHPFVTAIRNRLGHLPSPLTDALDAVADGAGHLWRMEDRRASRWQVGRVALLGDAAVGFLPTAGVGAAMAIESAGALAACLADTDRAQVQTRLAAFEQNQRPRSEAAQQNSRHLAKLMFTRQPAVAALRDLATRLMPARIATRPIRSLLDHAPTP